MSQSGNGHKHALHLFHTPKRVVSLVPSLTESMFDLGFGEHVVGVTDYCIYPAQEVAMLPKIGGPKNPRLADILALKPDLVLVNQEENTPELVEQLLKEKIPYWLSYPRTVRQSMDVLWTLVGIYQSRSAAARVETLEITLDWAENAVKDCIPRRVFCPIWQHLPEKPAPDGLPAWWMTFNQETYTGDLLRLVGGENIFSQRNRRYPLEADLGMAVEIPAGGRDTRYPRVRKEEVVAADPELILLPSEPYAFDEIDKEQICQSFQGTTAVSNGQVTLVDGSLLTWFGTRLARALQELPMIIASV